MGNAISTGAATKAAGIIISINAGLERSDAEWKSLRDRAIRMLATPGLPIIEDVETFAKLALEYERSVRDYRQAHKHITDLQNELNGWMKRDRHARGIE